MSELAHIEAETAAPVTAAEPTPVFEMRGVCKNFQAVRALDDVSFSAWPGEVHVLIGENGSGKSSLMKVLCGVYQADAGEFFHQGRRVEIRSPSDAQQIGIAVIFQEFSLVPYLDVAQNIFLGREFVGKIPFFTDRKTLYREAQKVLDTLGFDINPRTPVHELGVAQQQIVEIAKAMSQNARILVMDEPTAALSDRETERLFAMIHRLRAQGIAIVYISHRMAEVFELGDRITVLRDGKRVGHTRPKDVTPDKLVQLMVGRSIDMTYPRNFREPGKVVLEVKNLAGPSGIADINLTVREGEIVGLCGLVGSGRTEVARAIFGEDRVDSGEILIEGKRRTRGPEEAVALGAALVPESRKTQGLALIRTVGENLMSAALSRIFPNRLYRHQKAMETSADLITQLRIATSSPSQVVGTLSGGNQQKVVIGKWLEVGSRLFIFDEPTRGIDVGAKAEIFALIDRLVGEGRAVLMISSEQTEVIHVCDRAYVMREKRIVGELDRASLTEENIIRLST